jgi:GT2 family glycosyltransferase
VTTGQESRALREPARTSGRLETRGKFFFSGQEKVILKGVTYGPFDPARGEPDGSGAGFPSREVVKTDFDRMLALGANCLRTFTVPPRWLLDLAAERQLKVLIGIPWAEHCCFLDSGELRREIHEAIAGAADACAGHPAVAAYLVGNEIPPDIVRWHGAPRVSAFLAELAALIRARDPGVPVGYANFPSTEYLETDFADFLAFNVYLHKPGEFRRYLAHLQILAGDRPLLLTEFGMDSFRESEAGQASTLSWQVRTALEAGVAGTVVFSFTDEWFTGGHDVGGWAFGLVDRARRPKLAYDAVKRWYASPTLPPLEEYPKVSVVICAYNAETTMRACLDSLQQLRYPAYEVVVVDDGSTDRTGEIADEYEGIHVIHQENKGLSAARNVGIAASTGEIVAYTDSDCVVDPDWLHYLVATFLASGHSAVGGPNLPPPEDSLVAACVAGSPGGPLHVLLDDEEAEHIPGCNMAFRREVLEEIGGFDPIYRAAGDDVDLCWRLQDKGYQIGFSPAAVVWHFRRNTVKAYVGQQRGYGKAEALLYFRHPHRFNALGHSRWRGRIYGGISGLFSLRRPKIYAGVFGRGLFQTLYQPPSTLLSYLPMTLEWNLAAALVLVWSLLRWEWAGLAAAPLLLSWGCCLGAAWRARIDHPAAGRSARLLVALLTYWGPLVRSLERYKWWLRGLRAAAPPGDTVPARTWRGLSAAFWSDRGLEKEAILHGLTDELTERRYVVRVDQGWSEFDLEVLGGVWSRAHVTVCAENHGGAKRVLRARGPIAGSPATYTALVASIGLAAVGAAVWTPALGGALALAVATTAAFLREAGRLGRTLHESLWSVARRERLHYAPPIHHRLDEAA